MRIGPVNPLTWYGLTDPGRLRARNEDAFYGDAAGGLFIVADGMGGESAGEVASRVVVEVLPLLIRKCMASVRDLRTAAAKERLREAICELSSGLRSQSESQPGLRGMGSTVVVALIRGGRVLIGHLGDSRAYLIRSNLLEQLTKDHTLFQLLLEAGEVKPEEAAAHPARGRLTRFVGMAGEPLPMVRSKELERGDRLLLCTDGLTSMVSEADVFAILKQPRNPESLCRELVAAANSAGGRDNITVLIIPYPVSAQSTACNSRGTPVAYPS